MQVGLVTTVTRNAGESHATPRGLRAPAAPAPPFFGSPKKGGKESSPLATSLGFCLRHATPALRRCPRTGVAGVARTGPRPKAPPPAGTRQGHKTPRRPPHKNAPPLELKCMIRNILHACVLPRRGAPHRFVGLPQRITVLPIGEIGHRVLGRGGAERSECPPTHVGPMAGFPAFVATRRVAIKWAASFTWGCRGHGWEG